MYSGNNTIASTESKNLAIQGTNNNNNNNTTDKEPSETFSHLNNSANYNAFSNNAQAVSSNYNFQNLQRQQQNQQQSNYSSQMTKSHSTSYVPTSQRSSETDISLSSNSSNLGSESTKWTGNSNYSWNANNYGPDLGKSGSGASRNSITGSSSSKDIWANSISTNFSPETNFLNFNSFNFNPNNITNIKNNNNTNESVNNTGLDADQNGYNQSPQASSMASFAMKLSDNSDSSLQNYQQYYQQHQPNSLGTNGLLQSKYAPPNSPLQTYNKVAVTDVNGNSDSSTNTIISNNASKGNNFLASNSNKFSSSYQPPLIGNSYYNKGKSYSFGENSDPRRGSFYNSNGNEFNTMFVNSGNKISSGSTSSSNASAVDNVNFLSKETNAVGLSISSNSLSNESEEIKFQLQLKNSLIKNLEEKNETLVAKLKAKTDDIFDSSEDQSSNFTIPNNHEKLYNQIANKLMATQNELEDTKTRLESLMTAIYLNPTHTEIKSGRYDEEEMAHKIITKMQMLTEENEQMARMLSYGKSKEKDITIGLLKKQNIELKEKVIKLESKVNDLKS